MKNLLVAAMVALAAVYSAGCSVPSGQRTVGDVVDDSTITTRVKTRFVEDKIVSANRINVETLKGVVQLSGFATTEAERVRAAEIAAVGARRKASSKRHHRPAGISICVRTGPLVTYSGLVLLSVLAPERELLK